MPLQTDRYCQMLISVHKQVVFIKPFHCIWGIYGNLWDSSLDTCLLLCLVLQISHFQWRLGGSFSVALLSGSQNKFLLFLRRGLKNLEINAARIQEICPHQICPGMEMSLNVLTSDATGRRVWRAAGCGLPVETASWQPWCCWPWTFGPPPEIGFNCQGGKSCRVILK